MNVSEHIINHIWAEATGVNLSEEWTGTKRFRVLGRRFFEGYKWVHGRPTKIRKTIRPDSIWPEVCTQLFKKQKEKEIVEWAGQTAISTWQRTYLRGVDRWQRLLQGDCRCPSETGKGDCSCSAVHREGTQSRDTSFKDSQIQKTQREYMDLIAEKGMWEAFSMAWNASQFPFKKL